MSTIYRKNALKLRELANKLNSLIRLRHNVDEKCLKKGTRGGSATTLTLLSVIIPARDEEGCIASIVEELDVELDFQNIPHEIIVVDDGSTDQTWTLLQEKKDKITSLFPIQNKGAHGFGRAITLVSRRLKVM